MRVPIKIKQKKSHAQWAFQGGKSPPELPATKSLTPLNAGEECFRTFARVLKLPPAQRNYRFCEDRKFELDFAWPEVKVGVEINGGTFRHGGGAHTGLGQLRDWEKNNLALDLGWRIYIFSPEQSKSGEAAQKMLEVLSAAFVGGNDGE